MMSGYIIKRQQIKTTSVTMTQEQLNSLLSTITSTQMTNMTGKSFARCSKRFDGVRDYNKVEEFINNIVVYKKIEHISDEDALEGLPLLLNGTAATWWHGVKSDVKKWSNALEAIRSAFAPKKQPHDVYLELFGKKQTTETIDEFVCEKRALLSQLPNKRNREEEHLDFVYALLKLSIKKQVARTDFKSFAELLEKVRHLESLEEESQASTSSSFVERGFKKCPKRCAYCGKKGHSIEECRKRLAEMKTQATVDTKATETPTVSCYGCGEEGVFRSNCKKCKNKETPPKPVAFHTVDITELVVDSAKIPTIEITYKMETGYAYIDTAARTSMASTQLYKLLIRNGETFNTKTAETILADGSIQTRKVLPPPQTLLWVNVASQ